MPLATTILVEVLLFKGMVTVALTSEVRFTGKLKAPFASVTAVELDALDDDRTTCSKGGSSVR